MKVKLQLKPKIPIKLVPVKAQTKTAQSVLAEAQTKTAQSVSADAQTLWTQGVVVLPIFEQKELIDWNHRFKKELIQFPEYKNPTLSTIFVYGAFGALGNPSSYHNLMVRDLRQKMMSIAHPLFNALEQVSGRTDKRLLEQLFDRMCIRRAGTKTTAESWHRDIKGKLPETDDIFGGWINLDLDRTQYFSCIPGTHNEKGVKSGFAQIDPDKVDKTKKQIFSVPPGHWVVFYQQIIHEVIPRKMIADSYRVYLGFRLTASDQPLYDNKKIIEDQGVPQLPGGMPAPVYAARNVNFHLRQLIEWSQIFRSDLLETKKNKKSGNIYQIIPRFMKSLKECQLPLYPPYSNEEKKIMTPQLIN